MSLRASSLSHAGRTLQRRIVDRPRVVEIGQRLVAQVGVGAGQAKVHDLRLPDARDQHVRRLQVAVGDAAAEMHSPDRGQCRPPGWSLRSGSSFLRILRKSRRLGPSINSIAM